MSKQTKEWLELAVVIVAGAAVMAGISALFDGNFSEKWLYAVVGRTNHFSCLEKPREVADLILKASQ